MKQPFIVCVTTALTFLLMFASPASAQLVRAESSYRTTATGTADERRVWEYTFTFGSICGPCQDQTFARVSLKFVVPVSFEVLEDPAAWTVTTASTGAVTVTRRTGLANGLVLRVRASTPAKGTNAGTTEWATDGSAERLTLSGKVEGPVAETPAAQRWRSLVGGGFSLLHDDFAEYEVIKDSTDRDILVTRNDSRLRAAALTGVGFEVGKRVGLFAGLEYAAGTTALLDSFNVGLMIRVNDDASVVLGYARAKGQELSASVKRAAASYVKQHPAEFPGVGLVADESELENEKDYDGIPIVGFQGRAINDSWNGSLFVGVVFPVSIKIGGDKKNDKS